VTSVSLNLPTLKEAARLQALLKKSARQHRRLCPRQVLGVRLGLAGLEALGFRRPPAEKRLLVITETDGCFVDGLSAATGCTVGHRTLRVEDYGKTAAVFVDTLTGQSWRVAPSQDLREKASAFLPEKGDPYQAQLQAYQSLPSEVMFTLQPVRLKVALESLLSQPGRRVLCDQCGEEIMNEREIQVHGRPLCQTCAGRGYYQPETVL
jgi:formylmethanofuran dehydrogenase subunit E